MNCKLVYCTSGGTTKKTTRLLEQFLEKQGNDVEVINLGSSQFKDDLQSVLDKITDADFVGFGAPVYHMNMFEPMLKLFSLLYEERKQRKYLFQAFFYINYGGITSGKAFQVNARLFQKMGIEIVGAMKIEAPHFHKEKSFPNEQVLSMIEEFYIKLESNRFSPFDSEEVNRLLRPEKMRVRMLFPMMKIIGKHKYLHIDIHSERCLKCNKCVHECPVSAISLTDQILIQNRKCIHCYHCVTICHEKALTIDTGKLDQMIFRNQKIIGHETYSNQLFVHNV